MKVYLMYKNRDFDLEQNAPWNGPDLILDLQLVPVLEAMAGGDELLYQVAQSALLSSLSDGTDEILYRHAVLKDCLRNPAVIKKLYKLAVGVIGEKKVSHWATGVTHSSRSLLSRAVEALKVFLSTMKTLRTIADEDADKFSSEAFIEFFSRIKQELTSEYLAEIEEHLSELSLRDEILIGARLGKSNRGSNYILCQPKSPKKWFERVFKRGAESYTFRIDNQDENALRRMGELKNRGLDSVANVTAQSVDHVLNFLIMLRTELAFYLGCINLQNRLTEIEEATCFPVPAAAGEYRFSSEGLYDISLALSMGKPVVANDINVDRKSLIIVTGANKGGKTTFLRSVGLSQMMMHCGMFVPARSFSASLCTGLFTHFKRKEDVSLESGKLDDELNRMSQIADHLSAGSLVLFNEAFAATNEREGSEIARQIVTALPERQVKVIFVSHLYHFTHELYKERTKEMLFLRAERQSDGSRTYRLSEGEPLETSYGVDLYNLIFIADGKEENAKIQ
jgi:DNA mismatch repair ATPase MutS